MQSGNSLAGVINKPGRKRDPALLLGLVNWWALALRQRCPPAHLSLPTRLFSVVPLTILDLLNALYSVCQRRDDSEQDWIITNSAGTTHTAVMFQLPFLSV